MSIPVGNFAIGIAYERLVASQCHRLYPRLTLGQLLDRQGHLLCRTLAYFVTRGPGCS